MKGYLFDENLPQRLLFTPSLPVVHVPSLGKALSDQAIWDHAQSNELAIVTKDADFADRIMARSSPPWVVHLRFGNLRLKEFHSLLARVWPQVEGLLPAHKLIAVYPDRIESVRE